MSDLLITKAYYLHTDVHVYGASVLKYPFAIGLGRQQYNSNIMYLVRAYYEYVKNKKPKKKKNNNNTNNIQKLYNIL